MVAAGHRPWYVSNGFPCAPCQTAFEPILNEYGVDLAVFGMCVSISVLNNPLTCRIVSVIIVGHTHNSQLILPTAYNVTDPAKWNNPKAPAYSTSRLLLFVPLLHPKLFTFLPHSCRRRSRPLRRSRAPSPRSTVIPPVRQRHCIWIHQDDLPRSQPPHPPTY